MDDLAKDWSDWNPMEKDFYDSTINKYDSGPGAILAQNAVVPQLADFKTAREIQKSKYPYLVIKQKKCVTDKMLWGYFGEALVYSIEYSSSLRYYYVYFHNIASIEIALSKLHQFSLGLEYLLGRPKERKPFKVDEAKKTDTALAAMPAAPDEPSAIDLMSRTMQISAGQRKHPVFIRAPLVTKNEYTAKDSLLAQNDAHHRYLNVKFEFVLERHGAYKLTKTQNDQCEYQYRSGRILAVKKYEADFWLAANKCDGESVLFELPGIRKCADCALFTDVSCKRCQMPFCNALCFQKLAAAHAQQCDKDDKQAPSGPSAVNSEPDFKQLKLPRSGATVKITAFEQTNVVYIRSVELSDDVAYCSVLNKVMVHGKAAAKLAQLPRCGQIVIYKFEQQVVRAMVLNVDDPKAIYVVCVDFGNVEITMLHHLYACSAELARLPRYAVPVLLRGVPKRYMRPDVRELLYELDHTFSYVLKYNEREFDLGKGMQRVVLIESEMNRSLNRLLKTVMTPIEPPLSVTGFNENYLPHVHLPTGQHKEMVVMDNSFLKFGIVHCTLLDFAYEIVQMQSDLQSYGESERKTQTYAPPKYELCVAKYEGKWCRGICIELVGDGYPSILFIDYGNISPISVADIRPYPPQFTYPKLTTEFELAGLPAEIDDDLVMRLEQQLPLGCIVSCNVMHNKNSYSLSLDALEQQKLAK